MRAQVNQAAAWGGIHLWVISFRNLFCVKGALISDNFFIVYNILNSVTINWQQLKDVLNVNKTYNNHDTNNYFSSQYQKILFY
jgi:hypothetical protein